MSASRPAWRAVLLTVLLVFLLALFALGVFGFPGSSSLLASAETPATALTETPVPSNLQTTLYEIEAEAAANGWSARLHRDAADAWQSLGDDTRALAHWEASILAEPNATSLRAAASVALERGDWATAVRYLEMLHEMEPEDGWAAYYGGAIIATGNASRAISWLQPLTLEENPYQQAAQSLLVVLQDESSPVPIDARVGAVLANAQEWTLAEHAFQVAAANHYPFAEAMAYVALMRVQQGKEGAGWMQQALQLAPDDAHVVFVSGIYYRALEAYDQSVQAFLTAIILDPEQAVFYAELGNTYRAMGNLSDAETWLLTAITISGNDPLFEEALQRLYVEEAYLVPEPLLLWARQERNTDLDPVALSAQGWALAQTGRVDEGLAQVEAA
ncbi:MAG: tetratricopeptide repeat protein, partial [Anaerolineae bacterium]|nr:tetratricopeptide repeat protein [Anaerolineae bacterium]